MEIIACFRRQLPPRPPLNYLGYGWPIRTYSSTCFPSFYSHNKMSFMLFRATYALFSINLFYYLNHSNIPLMEFKMDVKTSSHQLEYLFFFFVKMSWVNFEALVRGWLFALLEQMIKYTLSTISQIMHSHSGTLCTSPFCPWARYQTTKDSPYTLEPEKSFKLASHQRSRKM